MRLLLGALVLFLFSVSLSGQRQYKYWVSLKDKNGSPYSLFRPAEFLSARALLRREKQGIALEENDLPPNPAYIRAIGELPGITIHGASRWLNGVAVQCDSLSSLALQHLPFVDTVLYLGPHLRFRNPPNQAPKQRPSLSALPQAADFESSYGYAVMQNSLLDLDLPHMNGQRGKGIWVAVMDGGFSQVELLHFFDSLDLSGRLIQGRDFVERDGAVLESSGHGTSVLSVMAANLPGYFVGTAPDATYFLLKTEDTGGEFPIEEVNWVLGAEWADSTGVDVVNASLGYTHFNDPKLGHWRHELDGKTAIGSKGASIAATKGMIICNSAGNEGDGSWKYIGVPADAPGIIAVGAVDLRGKRAGFSSSGPTSDGRIKPDLMAPGDGVIVAGNSGIQLGMSSGTSLASPMLTGAFATLWSAYPDKPAAEIKAAMFESSPSFTKADTLYGYGLPSVSKAWFKLGNYALSHTGLVWANSQEKQLRLIPLALNLPEVQSIEIRDAFGKTYAIKQFTAAQKALTTIDMHVSTPLIRGAYKAILFSNDSAITVPFMVW